MGKTANCQVRVFLSYASQHGYTLVNRRLNLSQEWVEDKAPQLTLPQAILLLKVTLTQPQLDAGKAIEIVKYYQRRHEAAYRSHRKRRLAKSNETEVSL